MKRPYILAIDQGTSSTKTIVFDTKGKVLARASEPLKTHYLEGGLVEQEPDDIYQNVLTSVANCLRDFETKGYSPADIGSCGISNQRETFVVWDKTGRPLYNAVVWQCKRSIEVCAQLKEQGWEDLVRRKTGLIIDPYFSGTKLAWLNQYNEQVKDAIRKGEAYFGTVDTWLLYKLTKGQNYLTDYSNASRTLLFNLEKLDWDNELIEALGLSGIRLPELRPSACSYGESVFDGLFAEPLAVTAMIGDSHAAAFGEGCFEPGTAKATLGTGCSVLMNTGPEPKESASGMVSTICWSTTGRVDYALEGVIVSCGSPLEWLKNELGMFSDARQTEQMALSVEDNNGVYMIPAFSGLGAPYWDMSRKGSIEGLTFSSTKNHIVRAALEAIAYQIRDVIDAMENDTRIPVRELMVNGGITSNRFVMQFLADLLDSRIIESGMPDASALGAALLAGLGSGQISDIGELRSLYSTKTAVEKGVYQKDIRRFYEGWKKAVRQQEKTADTA